MKVICIRDSNRPSQIPVEEWIVEGEIYTVIGMVNLPLQPGKLGLLLKEIQLSELSFPYEFYDAERFSIIQEDKLEEVTQEMMEESFTI